MEAICQLHADLRYYLCLETVDMRKQFQGLQGIVNSEFGRYLALDEAFVFVGKSRKMVKILHRESNGLTMYVRKLATGQFKMPPLNPDCRTCTMNYSEFVHLILGEKWETEGRFDENGARISSA